MPPPRSSRVHRVLTPAWLAVLVGLVAGALGPLHSDGLVFDMAVAARHRLWAGPVKASDSVAVIALDGRTLDAAEVKALPRTFLAPHWATLIDALDAGGARAVVFDFLFSYSANAFIPNHDRPFLAALARQRRKVVVARSGETVPAPPFQYALNARGDTNSLGMVDLVADGDGSIRRVPASFVAADGIRRPSLVAAGLAKAGAGPLDAAVLFAPSHPLERLIPTYSMIDVLRCADRPEALRQAIAGRIVFVGTTLPDEDRKFAADRLLLRGEPEPGPSPATAECALTPRPASAPLSGTVPGVFIHAAAADAAVRGAGVREAPPWAVGGLAATAALATGMPALVLPPVGAVVVAAAVLVALFAASAGLLMAGLWVPISAAALGAGMALGGVYASRYLSEERRTRRIQRAFNHYLSPDVVARLAESGGEPHLGGEVRHVTIMFADLSGFTALSGQVSPQVLMEVTNRYLSLVVEAVEATGGYVDKFIGDAVMAMWGAPADDADHAANAAAGACRAAFAVARERDAAAARGEFGFSIKIGLHTGPAVVGNVGAEQRFNYTAVGETVNIASRLEGLPGVYKCAVVVSWATAELIASRYLLCELDRIHVKGKQEPITVFMPVAAVGEASDAHRSYVADHEAALALYRAGEFEAAARRWRELGAPPAMACNPGADGQDHPASVMATRAEALAANPRPAGWDGVWTIPKG